MQGVNGGVFTRTSADDERATVQNWTDSTRRFTGLQILFQPGICAHYTAVAFGVHGLIFFSILPYLRFDTRRHRPTSSCGHLRFTTSALIVAILCVCGCSPIPRQVRAATFSEQKDVAADGKTSSTSKPHRAALDRVVKVSKQEPRSSCLACQSSKS